MTEEKNCDLCKMRLKAAEKEIKLLKIAVFDGDARYPSIKDRIFANELALKTIKESLISIAVIMREQKEDKKRLESDKRKLTYVLIGGALSFLTGSVLLLLTKLIGV